jgi:polyisoprenoid-binding protein YceI
MIKKILQLVLIGALTTSCVVGLSGIKDLPSGKYELDAAHSSVHFKVKHLGLSNYTARFTNFKADLDLNTQKPRKSKLVAVIKSNSIKTDYPFKKKKNFDKFLSHNENWLNSKKFPDIKFESTKITRLAGKSGTMRGNLTMLGVSKPIKFKVTFNKAYKSKPYSMVAALGFSAVATIKRSEWGFNALIPSISDKVEIIIETEFHKK